MEPSHRTGSLAQARMEWELLQLLLTSHVDRPLWSIEELLDETANPVVALDALASLSEVGLIQR
jgi:hypothetical protein